MAADVRSRRRAVAARAPHLRGVPQRVRPGTLGAKRGQPGEHARGTEEVFEERRPDQRARLFGSALYDLDGQPAYSDGHRGRSPARFDSVEQPHDGDSPVAERPVRADHRFRRNEADGNLRPSDSRVAVHRAARSGLFGCRFRRRQDQLHRQSRLRLPHETASAVSRPPVERPRAVAAADQRADLDDAAVSKFDRFLARTERQFRHYRTVHRCGTGDDRYPADAVRVDRRFAGRQE